jgi:hypothetical protein
VKSFIEPPSPEERLTVVRQLAQAEGISMDRSLEKLLSSQISGNGRTLQGALKRLRLQGTRWKSSSAVLQACGILDPYFADHPDWDLRHRVMKAIGDLYEDEQVDATDLAVYVLLKEAQLPEDDVARYFNVEPADAYLRCARFEKRVLECPRTREIALKTVQATVESLHRE